MRIGIDLGGSHIAFGIIQENGEILRKNEYNFSKEEKENIKETLKKILHSEIEVIAKTFDLSEIEMIGISAPRKT